MCGGAGVTMALLATSCTMRNKPSLLLDKGPEYLRTRTNGQMFGEIAFKPLCQCGSLKGWDGEGRGERERERTCVRVYSINVSIDVVMCEFISFFCLPVILFSSFFSMGKLNWQQ